MKSNGASCTVINETCVDISVPQNGWEVFPSKNIPPMFNYGHVYFYLVESVVNMNLPSDARTDDDEDFVDCMNTDTITAKPLKK